VSKQRVPESPQSGQPPRVDRRHRHANDPTKVIMVTMPIALREALDAVVVERRATRSGVIVMAVREWLERNEQRERHPGDAGAGSNTDAQP
jgi:hypothetical protein